MTSEGARVGLLYVTAIAGTAILYSFQTLYVQVDGPIPRGGTHAVRHNGYVGIAWGLFHMPYHFFLIAFATGLAILVRDVALPPAEAARQLIRAGEVATSAASFDDSARWLFAVGWGGSMIFSATIGAMHIPGPRAATKLHRIAIRVVISIAIMVGMPFADVSAGVYLGVFTIVTVILSMLEFLFVQMDRIGFFKSEASAFASTDSGPDGMRIADWTSDSSDSDEVDVEAGRGASGGDESEQLLGESCQDDFYLELKERMCKGHCSRLVAEKKKQKKCAKPENVDKDTL